MSDPVRVRPQVLADFARSALTTVGMPSEHAGWAAEGMLWADLRHLAAHGVAGKLPQCVGRIRAGGTNARPQLRTVKDFGAAVSLDGDGAWGQVAGVAAMDLATERALAHGVGLVTVRCTSSAAAMGHYAWRAAQRGTVALALTNGPALVAAPEGNTRVVGNQGHAIACPDGAGGTVLYDSATTLMSTGAMETAHEQGAELPVGVLRDRHGRPTRDPAEWAVGLLEPIGGHHGFGLSVGLEVLTGLLAGGDRFGATVGMPGELGEPQGVSLSMVAIRVDLASGAEEFGRAVSTFRRQVRQSGPEDGLAPRLPGERGEGRAGAALRDGVLLSTAQLERLRRVGTDLGLDDLRVGG
ncbi:MAG TPA: Ldh family oxidoreductase [Segeticoccus sp.]|jgi:LDH2 family malate/lactate/ureidoglycolate dehydrogenase|nr:Ldh family oxidoreductase [Segeticoccus sp.]